MEVQPSIKNEANTENREFVEGGLWFLHQQNQQPSSFFSIFHIGDWYICENHQKRRQISIAIDVMLIALVLPLFQLCVLELSKFLGKSSHFPRGSDDID